MISATPPLFFTGGQEVRNLASFLTSLNFVPLAFENAARYSNSETKLQCCDDRPMSLPFDCVICMAVLLMITCMFICMSQENATETNAGDDDNFVGDDELSRSSYCDSDVSTIIFISL